MDTRPNPNPTAALQDLCCPICRHELEARNAELVCGDPGCATRFPVVRGCPILINETNSIFNIRDYVENRVTTMDLRDPAERRASVTDRLRDLLGRITPDISVSISDFTATQAVDTIIGTHEGKPPRILVIGAGDARITLDAGCELIYSDVARGGLTNLVCDAHDIPFADESFDAVLAIAVLEHVADPYRVVAEIWRVLKPRGHVYAVTPFMQQVHMGRYDFVRFSHLGHRRLLRWFSETRTGVANGPGMVLAWSIERYVSGITDNHRLRSALRTLARFVAFPFSWSDRLWGHNQAAYDNASAYYFFGRKAAEPVSDREIIAGYRGTMVRD